MRDRTDGEDSVIWNTATGTKQKIRAYESLWPERYPAAALREIRATIGDPLWNSLYMQRPSLGEAQIFRVESFGYFAQPRAARVILAWDTASRIEDSNAYSVGVTLAVTPEGNFQILDVVRGRWEFGELARMVWQTCQRAYQMTCRSPVISAYHDIDLSCCRAPSARESQ